jgi:hypothetical protein
VTTKYLLPCRCGKQIVVEPREAGQTSLCPCGQSLLIPTMRQMSDLEPAPVETAGKPERVWGWQQGLLVLGIALAVVALSLGYIFRSHRPIAPIDAIDPQAVRETAERLSPLQTWHYWELMKQGLDRRVDQRYAEKMSLYHIQQGFAAVLGLAGIALIGTSVAIGKNGRRRQPGSQPESPAA